MGMKWDKIYWKGKYKLHIPKSQTVHSQKSVKYICISSWNYIVDKLNIIGGIMTFKKP